MTLSIDNVFRLLGIEPRGCGRWSRANCPWCHDPRKKSLTLAVTVEADHIGFICHRCDRRGRVLFAAAPDGVQTLKEKLTQAHEAWLVDHRKLDPELLARFDIRSNGHFIELPIPDPKTGKMRIKMRRCPDVIGKEAWQWGPGVGTPVFNAQVLEDSTALASGMALVLTEGEWDALVAIQVGFQHSISPTSGAIESEEGKKLDSFRAFADKFAHCKKIVLATDDDSKGILMREVLVAYFGKHRCWTVEYPSGCKDLNDVLMQHGAEAARAVLDGAKPYPIRGVYTHQDFPKRSAPVRYLCGVPGLDSHIRFSRGTLTTVTGIAGNGKSTVINAIVGNLAIQRTVEYPSDRNLQWKQRALKVCLGSFEGAWDTDLSADFAALFRGRFADQFGRKPTEDEVNRYLQDRFVIIDHEVDATTEDDLLTLDWFFKTAEEAKLRHDYDVLLVDPWNKLDLGGSGKNDFPLEKRALNRFKAFARLHNVIVIIVTHPSLNVRTNDGAAREPTMLDIAGGAHWANMSDFVISVHREDTGGDEVYVGIRKVKRREWGRRGRVRLEYRHSERWFSQLP